MPIIKFMAKIVKEKVVELDEEEVVTPIDKTVEVADPLLDGEVDPEAADEDGLDDTEIDPFKDKWEE